MNDGFNQQQSDSAIRAIHEAFSASPNGPSQVERIDQKFCCGIGDETVIEYCEKVRSQDRYEVSQGSCRAKSCEMVVPPAVRQAKDQGWVMGANNSGWQCQVCQNAQIE